jgi:hypothetical protein
MDELLAWFYVWIPCGVGAGFYPNLYHWSHHNSTVSDRFWGIFTFAFMIVFWPFFLGIYVYHHLLEV